MNAPNRSAEVVLITTAEATLPFPSEEARRDFLMGVLIPLLNQVDSGQWGWLVKTEQGNKIPADIIVWRPTMEHIDVLTDQGPMRHNHGPVTNPAWVAGPVESQPHPATGGLPLPTSPIDPVLAQLNNSALQNKVLTEYVITALSEIRSAQDRPLDGSIFGKKFTLNPRK